MGGNCEAPEKEERRRVSDRGEVARALASGLRRPTVSVTIPDRFVVGQGGVAGPELVALLHAFAILPLVEQALLIRGQGCARFFSWRSMHS